MATYKLQNTGADLDACIEKVKQWGGNPAFSDVSAVVNYDIDTQGATFSKTVDFTIDSAIINITGAEGSTSDFGTCVYFKRSDGEIKKGTYGGFSISVEKNMITIDTGMIVGVVDVYFSIFGH